MRAKRQDLEQVAHLVARGETLDILANAFLFEWRSIGAKLARPLQQPQRQEEVPLRGEAGLKPGLPGCLGQNGEINMARQVGFARGGKRINKCMILHGLERVAYC